MTKGDRVWIISRQKFGTVVQQNFLRGALVGIQVKVDTYQKNYSFKVTDLQLMVNCSKCHQPFTVTAAHWTTCPACRPIELAALSQR